MKKLVLAFAFISCFACQQNQAQNKSEKASTQNRKTMAKETIYQFKVKDLEGNDFDFASLKGKKVLIVNTASKCGLTPQYKDLQAIYDQYKDKNFVIVGFPANNFASQEPGTNEEIGAFCQQNYGVTFPMMDKISVKGDDMNEVYKFLTEKSKNGLQDSEVEWNFQKYLINEKGELVKVISPRTLPTDPEIVNWLKA
ncbi:glutathione peroxidase [Flavobacterium macacae]|uniref:Glutathione peroxidase n=1 Tax=Flavobacterium macacae TaxID=2488993 RepID=A0A3P3W3Y4_9FLAO|nr:glutathione peroxidase [Flavobacterium macacae]RRJ89127.1 glutathione peroxidase [Flavobacterium macacae]